MSWLDKAIASLLLFVGNSLLPQSAPPDVLAFFVRVGEPYHVTVLCKDQEEAKAILAAYYRQDDLLTEIRARYQMMQEHKERDKWKEERPPRFIEFRK